MTTGGGFFRSILSVEDMSSQVIGRITQKMNVLNTATEQVAARLQQVASAQLGAATAAQEGGRATEFQIKSAQKLGEGLEKLSQQGIITSGGLRRIAQQATLLARVTGEEGLAGSLRLTRRELELLAPSLQRAEETATAAGIKFQFMGDVSQTTSMRMRQLSASAQGAMLGMSLLEGNVIGLAFSLIFLQFSGFLKLSLGIAVATAIFIPFMKLFKGLLDERRRTEDLANALFLVTGNLEAFEAFEEQAKNLAENLGLTGKPARELAKAIATAASGLRILGEETTDERLGEFALAFLIARRAGASFEEAVLAGNKALEESEKPFRTIEALGREVPISLEEFATRGLRALTDFEKGGRVSINQVIAAYRAAGAEIPDSVMEAIVASKTGFITLEQAFGEGYSKLTGKQREALLDQVVAGKVSIATQEKDFTKGTQFLVEAAGLVWEGSVIAGGAIAKGLGAVGTFLDEQVGKFINSVIIISKALFDLAMWTSTKILDFFKKIWSMTVDTWNALKAAVDWSIDLFAEFNRLFGNAILTGIGLLVTAFDKVWGAIKKGFDIAKKFLGLFNPVGERIANNMGLVSSAFNEIGSEIESVDNLANKALRTLGRFGGVDADISLARSPIAAGVAAIVGTSKSPSSLIVNVDVHDNTVGSEEDAQRLGATISSEILRRISQGNMIGFHPSVV